MTFKGIDYEEIGHKIAGDTKPEDIDSDAWVRSLVNAENFPLLKEYLQAHMEHVESCHISGASSYLGIYKAIEELWVDKGSIDDNFNFIKAFLVNMPMMWC